MLFLAKVETPPAPRPNLKPLFFAISEPPVPQAEKRHILHVSSTPCWTLNVLGESSRALSSGVTVEQSPVPPKCPYPVRILWETWLLQILEGFFVILHQFVQDIV